MNSEAIMATVDAALNEVGLPAPVWEVTDFGPMPFPDPHEFESVSDDKMIEWFAAARKAMDLAVASQRSN